MNLQTIMQPDLQCPISSDDKLNVQNFYEDSKPGVTYQTREFKPKATGQ